jgi:hypothetical protein
MRNMKIALALFCGAWLSCTATLAQNPPAPPCEVAYKATHSAPVECEYRTGIIERIHAIKPADEVITVVARTGECETSPNLNQRRLHNVRAYLTEWWPEGFRRKPGTVILAEGEKVDGNGRLEFYVGGKLVEMMQVVPNGDVTFDSCYPPDGYNFKRSKGVYDRCLVRGQGIFYPCLDRVKRRNRKR